MKPGEKLRLHIRLVHANEAEELTGKQMIDYHKGEHEGPGTIRNHDPLDYNVPIADRPSTSAGEPPFRPDWSVHPGKTLHEVIDERGWTQTELARRCGVSQKRINEIVDGKAGISPRLAVVLERTLDVPAELWMNLQTNYEIAEARKVPNREYKP